MAMAASLARHRAAHEDPPAPPSTAAPSRPAQQATTTKKGSQEHRGARAAATRSQGSSTAPNETLMALADASKPAIAGMLQFMDKAWPVAEKLFVRGQQLWAQLEQYRPGDALPLLFGLLLVFFGGQLPITIAAIEAFRICGWESTRRALLLLHQQFKVALDASRKDDQVDDNRDGIADVKQIDGKALVSRKIALFLKVTDPNALNEGIKGVAAGCSAVVATLRLQFAQTITLGVSLGDMFERTAERLLRPVLEKSLPPEFHKWISFFVVYGCRTVAVSIAWWCTRVISTVHSATRGAQLVLKGVLLLAARFELRLPVDITPDNPAFPAICGAISGVGIWSQVMRGFRLSFPFNVLLLPLRVLEAVLWWVLSYHGK